MSEHADTIRMGFDRHFAADLYVPEAEAALDALAARCDALENALREIKEAAKTASARAAAPDYDEEAIRTALWRVVDLALAATDTTREETP